MSDAPEPTNKSYTLEQVKQALPALLAAGPDVMPADKRSRLLMGALAALTLAADKSAEGGMTPEIAADVELAGQVCGELVRAYRAATAQPAAAPAIESGQTAAGHTVTTVAAGKAEGPSDSEIRDALTAALKEKFPPQEDEDGYMTNRIWIADVFPQESVVVYEHDHAYFQIGYGYDSANGVATLTGEPVEVRRVYQPMGETPPAEGEPGAEMAPEGTEPEAMSAGGAAAKTAKGTAPPAVVIPLNLSEAYRQRKEAAAAASR